jgi:signal transduction histidine kinase
MEMPKSIVSSPVQELGFLAHGSDRRRIRDYAIAGKRLFIQRITIYSAAILLVGIYYDWTLALVTYGAIWSCEAYDFFVFRRILKHRKLDAAQFKRAMIGIYIGTALSAATIALFCISIAMQQSHEDGHFLSLFLLVSASIFATMNNHHFLPVLGLRLAIYVVAILYIPIRDVWIVRPPLTSEIWLHLFTVIFVLAFIVELARNFFVSYSAYLVSRNELEAEHQLTLAAYHAKTRFLATVSHELRTPLTSIKGALDLVNSGMCGAAPDKMMRMLEVAGRNATKLSDLVGDLLLLQTSEAGKMDLVRHPLDVGTTINGALEKTQPQASKLNVTIRTEVAPGRYWVVGDAKRIEQVLTNLLSNAVKFSHPGGEVGVKVGRHDDMLRISIIDQGIGIPEGMETKIFEEFTQVDSSDERQYEGTGLGLSICKRIVDAHGGHIGFVSKLGEGTTFHVDLTPIEAPQDSHS